MNSKKITHRILILFWMVFTTTSCRKFVEIPPPKNQIISQTAFADNNTAIATLNGIYSKMMTTSLQFSSGGLSTYPAMSADELTYYSASTRDEFISNQLTQANNTVVDTYLWASAYNQIYAANSCIEGAQKSSTISGDTKNMVIGEALFVRSFIYFYLINTFGDVPLITSSDYEINKDIQRTPVASIYEQIKTDLNLSVNLLKDDYATTGRTRPNKATAQALLARIYLYLKDWPDAIKESDLVIANSKYQILSDLNSVFLSTSQEAIWQLAPVISTYNTWDGSVYIPSSSTATPTYLLAPNLVSSFSVIDKRKNNWIGSRTYLGQAYYYPFKYKVRTNTVVTEYQMVFRLAELYLIRSEAKAETNDLSGALSDINIIRNRAGVTPLSSSISQTELLSSVQTERKLELFTEWGHRWFDLKRTNTANQVLGGQKPTWKPYAALYPIPYTQILINTALTQNPGY